MKTLYSKNDADANIHIDFDTVAIDSWDDDTNHIDNDNSNINDGWG